MALIFFLQNLPNNNIYKINFHCFGQCEVPGGPGNPKSQTQDFGWVV